MAATDTRTITVPTTAPVEGGWVDIRDMVDKWLHVTGFDSDEVDFELSDMDDQSREYTPAALDGLITDTLEPIEVPHHAKWIRCTTVSGTPVLVATICGLALGQTPQ